MGFLDGLLDTLTFGAFDAIGDLISAPGNIWAENRSVNNSKELIDHQTGRTKELQQHQADLGKDVFDYTFGKESSLNQQMMQNSPSVQKQAMISAGINPASNFGTFSGNLAQSSAPAFSASAGSASAPMAKAQSLFDLMNAKSLYEQSQLIKEQKRKLSMENDATEEENRWYAWAFDPEFDNLVYKRDIEKGIDGYVLPDVEKVVPKARTRKGVEARELAKARINSELAKLDSMQSQEELAKLVADGKIKDNEVINALIKLPLEQYNEVMQRVAEMASHINLMSAQSSLAISQQELNKLEKEFSPKGIVDKILDKPLDIGTWFQTIIALAIKKVFGR